MGFNPQHRTRPSGQKRPVRASDVALVAAAVIVCLALVVWGIFG